MSPDRPEDEVPGTEPSPGSKVEREPGIHTFLIADIRGYTPYTQQHGDEAAARLAAKFAESVEEVVPRFGGQLLELRGDEALVVFTSARQAIRAALALQAKFCQDDPAGHAGVPVGIGIDAGEAVSVRDGFRGAALNVAARLCGLASAGEVLASPEVVHLATRVEGVRFRPVGAVQLKGLSRKIEAVAVEPETTGQGGAGKVSPPFRRTRLRRLPPTARRRSTVAVLVIAAAGVVLTALLWGPWLPPAEQGSSAEDDSSTAEPPLRAVVLVEDEFPRPVHPLGHPHMFPAGSPARPVDYPPAGYGALPEHRSWEADQGGVPVIGQTVRLVLEGVTNEPVLITRVDPVVVNRRPPLRGWWVPPEPGGGARVRYFETGLECARPQLVALGGHHGPGLRPVRALNLEVSRLDKEQLEITAYSAKHYLEWGIDVTYVADGQVHTLMVRDPRLRVTAISRGLHGYFPALHTTALRRAPAADPTSQDVAYWERVSKELCPR